MPGFVLPLSPSLPRHPSPSSPCYHPPPHLHIVPKVVPLGRCHIDPPPPSPASSSSNSSLLWSDPPSFFVSRVYSGDITWQISIVRPWAPLVISLVKGEYSAISPPQITRGDRCVCSALINCSQGFIRTTHTTGTFNLSPLTPENFLTSAPRAQTSL